MTKKDFATVNSYMSEFDSLKSSMDEMDYKLYNTQTEIHGLKCNLIRLKQDIKHQKTVYETWLVVLTGAIVALLIAVISMGVQ